MLADTQNAQQKLTALADARRHRPGVPVILVSGQMGEEIAIEVKGKSVVTPKDERSLSALAEELPLKRRIVVCLEPQRRRSESGTEIIPAEEFLAELWDRGGNGLLG